MTCGHQFTRGQSVKKRHEMLQGATGERSYMGSHQQGFVKKAATEAVFEQKILPQEEEKTDEKASCSG